MINKNNNVLKNTNEYIIRLYSEQINLYPYIYIVHLIMHTNTIPNYRE